MPSSEAMRDSRRSVLAAALLGVGAMAAVDEIVFHQILAWHHLFDRSTPALALLSDGLLHSAELILFVLGFFMFMDLRARRAVGATDAWGGFFLGLGSFQLFDGIVDHKLLGLHQVRYVDNLLPYDLAWNGFGVLLLAIGFVLVRRSRSRMTAAPGTRSA